MGFWSVLGAQNLIPGSYAAKRKDRELPCPHEFSGDTISPLETDIEMDVEVVEQNQLILTE